MYLVQYPGQQRGEGGVTGGGGLRAELVFQAAQGQSPFLGQQGCMNSLRALDDPAPARSLLTSRLFRFLQHAHMALSILQAPNHPQIVNW